MGPSGRSDRLGDLLDSLWDALDSGASELPGPRLCEGLMRVVGAEVCAWHQFAYDRRTVRVRLCPDRSLEARMEQVTQDHGLEHPLISHYLITQDLSVLAPEDVAPDWRRHWVRAFLRREMGVTEQLAIPVSFRDGVLSSFVLGRREGRAFSDRDRCTALTAQRALTRADAVLLRMGTISTSASVHVQRTRAAGSPLHLTPQEFRVLGVLATGASREAAAHELGIAKRTIDRHVENINAKCCCHSLLGSLHHLGFITVTPT